MADRVWMTRRQVGPLLLCVFLWMALAPSLSSAQHGEPRHAAVTAESHHDGHAGSSDGWEGSLRGIAYSERNHHVAGLFVVLIGLAELSHAFRWTALSWARFVTPAAMLTTGLFLMIWSDHDAWPIGSLTFTQSFFGQEPEIVQHKVFGLAAVAVGSIELIRRRGGLRLVWWMAPLPLMAIVGGLMLFAHSHGDHPSGEKIALHHAIMGTMAVTAGSSKLLSGWVREQQTPLRSEIIWACLIVVIGAQLLIYSE
ncbi:MAG: hypothetical protein P0111_16275 [Nitrospira sp.]|nr:hypothetical protein [Nitrospira sp.]